MKCHLAHLPARCATAFKSARRSPETGHHLSSCLLDGPRGHRLETHRVALRERADAGMAEDEEPEFRAAVMPGFVSGLPTRIEGYRRRAEDARSKAENTRFGKAKVSWLQLARLLGRAGRPASTSRANCRDRARTPARICLKPDGTLL